MDNSDVYMNKQDLYTQAKDAYYNGEEIMTDLEFDELEAELGLENQGYIGTHHQKSYTVPHSFIMGSLSKVQIKESDDHTVDWKGFSDKVMTYLGKSLKGNENNGWYFESTPKYDGCSFDVRIDSEGNLIAVSTRGDGEYGKDITVWFKDEWEKSFLPVIKESIKCYPSLKEYVVRGECLVKKYIFDQKYSKDFTLPRSFVAGVLGQDWEDTDKQKEMRADLSWICYDYRVLYENGTIEELDYSDGKYFPGQKAVVEKKWHRELDLCHIYAAYNVFRRDCDFALDGFVLKPGVQFRLQDGGRARQEDCVAIKFLPEIVEGVMLGIEWNVGKNGEYYPTGILKDVILGGKKVNRVSLSNYGKVIEEGLGEGSIVKISLAGDIIPYLYSVVLKGISVNVPEDSYVDGVHLMKAMTDQDRMYIKFLNSVKVLKPDGIGEAVARKLFEIWNTENIVDFMINPDKWHWALDNSKSSQNIVTALDERKKTLTLPDLIQSMGYENCGEKNSLYLAKVVSGLSPDYKGIPTSIIDLGMSLNFLENVSHMMSLLGIQKLVEEKGDKQYVILTGSPKSAGYDTKSDFLTKHPQFAETTRWDQCSYLITDSLDSTSSKMEKAKKKGISIKTYQDF